MFVDKTVIRVSAGRGGDGCCAFRREKYVPRGGPAGGDGGNGGSVLLVATHRRSTLQDIARQTHFRAKHGMPGRGSCMTGRSARDLVVPVPLGTVVRSAEPGDEGRLLRDLTSEGERYLAARGGAGGRGNARFATSTNQAPTEWEPGGQGEETTILLELKLIADVGLVGLPSAGKSTLISRISAARPKIAQYPFTTLSPVPGLVRLGDFRSCVVADIPGLIAGAHQGVGLGIEFLRHVERTRMLVHVIDVAPLGGLQPEEAYRDIRCELKAYGAGLEDRREILALNKIDLTGAMDKVERFRRSFPHLETYAISAVTGEGLKPLLGALGRHLEELDEAPEGSNSAHP
ncbi:GTPase ObgE [Planctomycetota bacterium]